MIQRSLNILTQGKTLIAIVYRLSTIIYADLVVIFKDNCIIKQGHYSELLTKRGELWKYHQMQFESFSEKAVDKPPLKLKTL